jgi:hypothetical protein
MTLKGVLAGNVVCRMLGKSKARERGGVIKRCLRLSLLNTPLAHRQTASDVAREGPGPVFKQTANLQVSIPPCYSRKPADA